MAPEGAVAPYVGLRPFSAADSAFFFGRATERRIVAANLTASRLTILYGPSGVGKSSVLDGGVVHDLAQIAQRRPDQPPRYAAVSFREWSKWRADPLAGVTRAIHEGLRRDYGIDLAGRDGADFPATLDAWMKTQRGGLLLILDQFEEYLLYHERGELDDTFARAFPGLIDTPELRVNVLVSLRDDAITRLDRFKGQIPQLLDNRLELKLLSRRAAEEAIRRPLDELRSAGLVDVAIEDSLVEKVLDEVAAGRVKLGSLGEGDLPDPEEHSTDRPIEAPYLQLVMERIWREERSQGSAKLRLTTFEKLGWAQRIVQNHLDTRMDRLSETEQEVAAKVFRYLVTPSGAKIALSPYDLAHSARVTQERVEVMLEGLADGDARVLRSIASPHDDPRERRFEIYHDALARAILDWTARREKSADERRLRDTEARLRREQKKRRLARGAAGVLAVGVIILLGVLWQVQRRTAFESRSRALAAQAIRSLRDDSQRSMLLALQAASLTYGRYGKVLPEVQEALHGGMSVARGRGTLQAHARVYAVAASPDGLLVATGDAFGTTRLWDAPTGREVRTLVGQSGAVTALAFSPNGQHLAAAYSDSLIVVWPLNGASDTTVLRRHRGGVYALAYDPTGRWVVTGGIDSTAWLWDAASGRPVHSFVSDDGVRAVGFADSGRLVVTSSDRVARVWDRATGRGTCRFDDKTGVVYALVALPPAGKIIAMAGRGAVATLWSAERCEEIRRLKGHSNSIFAMAASRDGGRLATAGADGRVKVWNPRTGAELFALVDHSADVLGVDFSADGRRLYTASADSTTRVWDASRVMSEVDVLEPGDEADMVRGLAFNPRRPLVAATNFTTGALLVSDLRRPRRSYTRDFGITAMVTPVVFSPDGDRIAVGVDHSVRVLDVETGGQLNIVTFDRDSMGTVRAIDFSPDGSRIAIGGSTGRTALWAPTGDTTLFLSGDLGPINTVAFNPNGHLLAVGGDDGTALMWDLRRDTAPPDTVERNDGRVTAIAFSPDGKVLAAAGDQNVIRLVSVSSPRTARTLAKLKNTVWSIAFSPDGARLASANFDGTARMWDVASGNEVLQLGNHAGRAYAVAFSDDGHYVASSSAGAIHVSIVDPGTLLLRAWSYVNRPFTDDECRAFGLLEGSHCPRAQAAVVEGRRLARAGDHAGAAAQFAEARRLDPTFRRADPDSMARAVAADAGIARGLALLRTGRTTEAMVDFRKARTLDVSGAGDVVPEIAGGIGELLRRSDTTIIDSALVAYREAVSWNDKFAPTAETLNSLCWWGTIGGHWKEVGDICDAAVKAAPDDRNIGDSRGVNRALSGDRAGAIEDFAAFVAAATSNPGQRAARARWIKVLQAGGNPFTRQELAKLRVE